MFKCRVCGNPTEHWDDLGGVALCSNRCTDEYYYGWEPGHVSPEEVYADQQYETF